MQYYLEVTAHAMDRYVDLLKHARECAVKGCGCADARALYLHARECKAGDACPVRGCALAKLHHERLQRSIDLHLGLMAHAAKCPGGCDSANCAKMQVLLVRYDNKDYSDVSIHRRVKALLVLHARQCEDTECGVSCCAALKREQEVWRVTGEMVHMLSRLCV